MIGSLLAAVLIVITIVWQLPDSGSPPNDSSNTSALGVDALLGRSRAALAQGDFARAERWAVEVLQRQPRSGPALLLAGEAAMHQGHTDLALQRYAQVPESDRRSFILSRSASGSLLLHLGRWSEAEQQFRECLRIDADNLIAHERLGFLLSTESRRWEAQEHLFQLVRLQEYTVEQLMRLGNPDEMLEQEELLQQAIDSQPSDIMPRIGLARIDMQHERLDSAEQQIRMVLDQAPEQVEAQAILGSLLLQQDRIEQLAAWHRQLPAAADGHPDIWFVRGCWMQRIENLAAAARCLWESIKLQPLHQQANYRLAQVLLALGRQGDAQVFLDQAQLLEQVPRLQRLIFHNGLDAERMRAMARLMEKMGRPWEAWAWYQATIALFPEQMPLQTKVDQYAAVLNDTNPPPRVLPDHQPARRVDLSSYPWPAKTDGQTVAERSQQAGPSPGADIRLEDLAQETGLQFTYFNNAAADAEVIELYQQIGGGIGILDFDLDGWPDVYFTQGSDWPAPTADSQDGRRQQADHRDRLLRNSGQGRFVEVTLATGLGDRQFSQGTAVGDFNNDGFPDLLVANIGRNRLYRNEGDGTFTEVSDAAGLAGEQWTTSCLIADLNADGLPDIYEVNYLVEEALRRRCYEQDRLVACTPKNFDGEQDQLYLNLGDGRFQNITSAAGIVAAGGKGLGVLAIDVNSDQRLDLFVANDTTANFLFVNETPHPGEPPAFVERALLSGLAFDQDGRAQACMGIAADDADGDGLVDLVVTNFYHEPNTLYRQTATGFFVDDTRRAGLYAPTYPWLGFGIQFVDLDLNGASDLVIANGHVTNRENLGEPLRMPAQVFYNQAGGQFRQLAGEPLGGYFAQRLVGRSLAIIDWDRDGRQDLVVSHLFDPAALLTNRTSTTAAGLQIRLCGVGSTTSRDAIGSRVEITVAGKTYRKHLFAGDGFQSSNQRVVHFGLGSATAVEQLVVHWPDGTLQSFDVVPQARELTVVQGKPTLYAP